MASQSSSSTTATHPARAYAQANPIDLTLEDDDEDIHVAERMPKRQCTMSRSFNAQCSNTPNTPSSTYNHQSSSGLSPAMSHSSLAPHTPHGASDAPSSSRTPQLSPSSSYYRDDYHNNSVNALRAQFQGPSNSSAFFQPRPQALPPYNPLEQPSPPLPQHASNGSSSSGSQAAVRQVIDLTGSPSPPPSSRPSQPPPQLQPPQQPQLSRGNLPADLPPKTPVCIGVLNATALVLYPISYLNPPDYGSQDSDWAPVRLQYEHVENKPGGTPATINIRPPSVRGMNGEIIPAETFAVVEQKVATHLGPMLGKGLIRLDAKIRRGNRTLPILQLQMLVFTPKGNIDVVSQYLHANGLYLDHPTLPSDIQYVSSSYYCNPHNPPPGGHSRGGQVLNRPGYMAPTGNILSRWSAPAVAGRSVEVQRSQVDEVFKSLKGGDELDEADPPPEVATKLYPHQLKALTFLLAREQELGEAGCRQTSLWQERLNPLSQQVSWVNIVTQAEEFSKPFEAKGAILADDMGLGKTITCVSLIAATLRSARAFAETPLTPPPTPPLQSSDAPLTASHFQGSVWGIPPPSIESHGSSTKANKKMAREQDRIEAQYTRACRIKMKSRATLIICPLSTVVNWEDQFKEHWRGEVIVCGGQSGVPPTASQPSTSGFSTPTPTGLQLDIKAEMKKPTVGRLRDGPPLRVYVYHGNARRLEPTFLADFDAVITTYSTLASEFSKQTRSMEAADDDEEDDADGVGSEGFIEVDGSGQPITKSKGKKPKKRKKACGSAIEATSPLQSIHWFRVVLDEAHSIKETNTVGCRASCDLVADRRLCLTGTPVQNKLDDVYALIKFLRLAPFDDKNTWNEFIGTPVKYAQPLGVARLQTIMKCITLRRTKESRAEDGKRILSLPPRTDELRLLKFDQQEQAIYDQFFNESKAEFHELSHKNEVMKNYVGILQKILRLRQICDHFELVQNKGLGLPGDAPSPYEDIVATVAREGLDLQRGAMIFALLREAGTTQCVECQCELSASMDANNEGLAEVDAPAAPAKRGRKPKASASTSRTSTRQNSPSAPQPVLTRCQHLFCAGCFRASTFPGWPNVQSDVHRACSICQTALLPSDAVQLNIDLAMLENVFSGGTKKKAAKKEKRQKGIALEDFHPSTKVRALLGDLIHFSKANPYSANYDPSSIEVQMVDGDGNCLDDGVTKTVVFSQWTSMLDKVEDALEIANIRYDRLDGTMKRDERTRAMEALKHDPSCEVLLVSLKAGGVGLNLTAAQRVYLMDPYWNPAVENQAVDRIHRLGQTRPVTTVKLIIENTIEARLLEVQKKKTELANITLGPPMSKSDLQARRMEELQQLFAA
ncbi:SNF2 family N-terminal domain-containing protein [Dichomitus squalens]|uniref:SNF2 family N-terminal domain-containing protein n=1 Tax=Dichomitus squalens TaxID=114155 RepID=A0A4Q9N710_9APHY|nr:SNF2 family N-terminal domain-containing protein [Dichomitus squalens]